MAKTLMDIIQAHNATRDFEDKSDPAYLTGLRLVGPAPSVWTRNLMSSMPIIDGGSETQVSHPVAVTLMAPRAENKSSNNRLKPPAPSPDFESCCLPLSCLPVSATVSEQAGLCICTVLDASVYLQREKAARSKASSLILAWAPHTTTSQDKPHLAPDLVYLQ